MRRAILLGLVCLLASSELVTASDEGTIAASLKDQAAECRYFLQVCDDTRRSIAVSEAALKAREQSGSREDLREAQAAFAAASTKGQALLEVRNVIRAKHAKPPACLARCDDLLK